jgi:hypothetical protein
MCNFPFDQRAEIEKKGSSSWVKDLSNVAHICDESQIVHAAAGILRRQISDITISDDEYPAPE